MVSRFYVQNGKMLEAPNRRAAMEALKLGHSHTEKVEIFFRGFPLKHSGGTIFTSKR